MLFRSLVTVLLISTSSLALASDAEVEQSGNKNSVFIDQVGSAHGATVKQFGEGNNSQVSQNGHGNSSRIIIYGDQNGTNGATTSTLQLGTGNKAVGQVTGDENNVSMIQAGARAQEVNLNLSTYYVTGDRNQYRVRQAGDTNSTHTQINGNDNRVEALGQPGGSSNLTGITLDGDFNEATVTQGFQGNQAYIDADGVDNTASVNQVSAFNSYAEILQQGNSHNAAVTQSGNLNRITIHQR